MAYWGSKWLTVIILPRVELGGGGGVDSGSIVSRAWVLLGSELNLGGTTAALTIYPNQNPVLIIIKAPMLKSCSAWI